MGEIRGGFVGGGAGEGEIHSNKVLGTNSVTGGTEIGGAKGKEDYQTPHAEKCRPYQWISVDNDNLYAYHYIQQKCRVKSVAQVCPWHKNEDKENINS